MRIKLFRFFFILAYAGAHLAVSAARLHADTPTLSSSQMAWIGNKIFENECSSKKECLVSWNDGEEFLSLGIGHFIWYPEGQQKPFDESFIRFLSYAKSKGVQTPGWLQADDPPCPWKSREDFLKNRLADPKLETLTQFLSSTKPLQTAFMIRRFRHALPAIIQQTSSPDELLHLKHQLLRLTSHPAGLYALIDYINFKGLGIFPGEHYQGHGWGLFQVLINMNGSSKGPEALENFAQTAEHLLHQRVAHAPAGRNERQWLPGWHKRLQSYLEAVIYIETEDPSLKSEFYSEEWAEDMFIEDIETLDFAVQPQLGL